MIYFDDGNIILRAMLKSDRQNFVHAFAEQNWHKPLELFNEYYNQQENGEKAVIVAEVNNEVAGYVTLLPFATMGPFAYKNIPELVDLNVLMKFQKKGIGNKLMDIVEELAKEHSDHISLAVGLHDGYGAAQRIYVKRGYIPDGTGAWYRGKQLEQYAECANDDDLILYFLKDLHNS